MQPARLRLGQLLVDAHIVTSEQLEQVLALQRTDGRRLGALLVESGLVTETQLTQILSQQFSVPWVSLYHIDFSRELLARVPREVAEKYCLVPIYVRPVRGQGDTLYVAMDDPMNEEALNECAALARLPARPMIAAPSAILKAIRVYYGGSSSSRMPAAAPITAGAPAAPNPKPAAAPSPAAITATPAANTTASPPSLTAATAPPEATRGVEPSASDQGPDAHAPFIPRAVRRSGIAVDDDAPSLEVREVELPTNGRRRAQVSLTFLDGTTIKMPAARRRSEPPAGDGAGRGQELTAADVLAALRAAAHGADAADILGSDARWEKLMAALLALLLRKNLIFERELLDELRKI